MELNFEQETIIVSNIQVINSDDGRDLTQEEAERTLSWLKEWGLYIDATP